MLQNVRYKTWAMMQFKINYVYFLLVIVWKCAQANPIVTTCVVRALQRM